MTDGVTIDASALERPIDPLSRRRTRDRATDPEPPSIIPLARTLVPELAVRGGCRVPYVPFRAQQLPRARSMPPAARRLWSCQGLVGS